jgi:hypothetical protein
VNPGFFDSVRAPKRRSCSNTSSIGSPLRSRTISFVCSTPPSFIRILPGYFCGHPGTQVVFDVHPEMAFQFGGQIRIVLVFAKQAAHP